MRYQGPKGSSWFLRFFHGHEVLSQYGFGGPPHFPVSADLRPVTGVPSPYSPGHLEISMSIGIDSFGDEPADQQLCADAGLGW